ncbi:MAG: glycerol-3-phosphate 1-O-acyltransferase PlsY [Candidatus Omnitrophota bacterium]|jgi:glycerol-3-phosphate acyltransferase PlsY
MLWITTGIIVSYLIGSIPTAYIFGRLLKGVDIRKYGSGNVGATNALRVLGRRAGITVLILDIFKGFFTVVFIGNLVLGKGVPLISEETLRLILGFSCICGHNWTIFLNFRGGKGIAASLGVLIGLAFKIGALKIVLGLLILTWFIVFFLLGIVSIASVITAIALPVFIALFAQTPILICASLLLCIFIIVRHKSNLKRFFKGEEPRLNFKKKP